MKEQEDVTALEVAIETALQAHEGQKDRSGEPYILHPLRVMDAVKEFGERTMVKAVLHDVVEDTDVTIRDIEVRFGADVATTVWHLTQKPGEDYMVYIDRVIGDATGDAAIIKIADIKDNLLPSRSKGRPKSAIAKYKPALEKLGLDFQELVPGRMQLYREIKEAK